jgi:hypothetical protein
MNRLGEVSIRILPSSIEARTFDSLNQLLIQNEDFSGSSIRIPKSKSRGHYRKEAMSKRVWRLEGGFMLIRYLVKATCPWKLTF